MKSKKNHYSSPLYWKDVSAICSEIKEKLFLRTYADIERIIGCHNGYISQCKKRGVVMLPKWSNELISLNKNGENYIKKYDCFKYRKVKKTVNNSVGVLKTSEIIERFKRL
jgi:hypothetical protein